MILYKTDRLHKLLPLLEDFPVTIVEKLSDLFKLKWSKDDRTVVMIDSFARWGVYGIVTALFLKASLAVRLRGEFFREQRERLEARSGILRWVQYYGNVLVAKFCLHRANLVLCNSNYLEQVMAPHIKGRRTAVVHNPYTTPSRRAASESQLSEFSGGLNLLTITNFTFRSKCQPVLEAVSDWTPPELWEDLDLYWIICGSGHYKDHLLSLIRKQGLEERVRMIEWSNDVPSLYEWCHILVHPTRLESLPNVVMEAFMLDRPVVTNVDSCGTRELVRDGENGFVVSEAAPFAAAVRSYAESPELRERHAQAGRRLIEYKFSTEAQRREMRKALGSLTGLSSSDNRADES